MADPRFFARSGPFSLAQLAEIAGATVREGDDQSLVFEDVAALSQAGPKDITFLDNKKYADAFAESKAGAAIINPAMASKAPSGMALLLSSNPYRGYAKIAQAFYPTPLPLPGISPLAFVDPSAMVDSTARIEAGAFIGKGAEIGARTIISPNAVIGSGVKIGDDCQIGPTSSLSYCLISNRVIIHGGVRIGQDGFGFAMGVTHEKVPQLGRVLIGNDVEIGANTTIDRGAGPDTIIGDGTKIDNLVQIGHNVRLGKGCIVVAHVGISGSTVVEDYASFGGQAGIAGHLHIGKGAKIAAQSGVMRDVKAGEIMAGSPAFPAKEYWRHVAYVEKQASKKKD